jgi:hypothetical protein
MIYATILQSKYVRLAQLVERYIDIVEVTSSSLVSDTAVKMTNPFKRVGHF